MKLRLKKKWNLTLILFGCFIGIYAQIESIVDENLVFQEKNGQVAVEAEYFYKQTQTDVRQWYRFNKESWSKPGRDDDDPHCVGASNNAYLELLPDTRVHHGDDLIDGVNITDKGGVLGVLHYKVNFKTTGRYYVWARAYSTGPEDNGLHVGIDGTWPESGLRMQWCEGKTTWRWESKQRIEESHCGVPYQIYLDINKKGVHEIIFSAREDGFEFDKFLMTTDKNYVPKGYGPAIMVKKGELPDPFPVVERDLARKRTMFNAIQTNIAGIRSYNANSFSTAGSNFIIEKDYLQIEPKETAAKCFAVHKPVYGLQSGNCDLVFIALGDKQGKTEFSVEVDGTSLGSFIPPSGDENNEKSSKYCKVWKNVKIKDNTVYKVIATKQSSNALGNWAGIVVTPKGKGEKVLKAIDDNELVPGAEILEKIENKFNTILEGEIKKWHKITLTFNGPEVSEADDYNAFMNYRLDVVFRHQETGKEYLVPGYFAADGNAGNTSAIKGNKWRVHFAPDETGEWIYTVNFRKGNYAAVSDKKETGISGGYMDRVIGVLQISESDKTGRDFRGKGMLQYVGERYLKFAGTGEYFLKVGSDAPENMLSYEEFDGTFHNDGHQDHYVKTWEAHEKHWNVGDPTWKNGKGKDIIGAVNYLSSKGMNAFSFLTNNIKGDDQNVFPYVDYDTWDRIDCSKMDQWEVLFEHADKKGMFLHFKLSEVENQGLLDGGGVGCNSKLYYRELIARFGHHLALNWNIGEENGDWMKNNITPPQFTWQRWSMAGYFAKHDPYKHHIVIHNGNPFDDMLGAGCPLTGASVQTNRSDFGSVHNSVLHWINASKKAGKQWAVACDEPGDATHSLVPDAEDPEHNNARMNGLWGAFMAGSWGTEWYFGYKHPHSDLTCQDYATRDLFWDQGKVALDFFKDNEIPFWEMESRDDLILNKNDYAFVKTGEVYLFYLKNGSAKVDLTSANGKLSVMWFNPRTGGKLQKGSKKIVKAENEVDLGNPPEKDGKDWLVVVRQ